MEVVSTTREDELSSVELGHDLGVDRLMGGVHVEEALRILEGCATRYLPFAGKPSGHPTRLGGSAAEVEAQCRAFATKGCAGVDILAYRATEAEPLDLIVACRRGLKRPGRGRGRRISQFGGTHQRGSRRRRRRFHDRHGGDRGFLCARRRSAHGSAQGRSRRLPRGGVTMPRKRLRERIVKFGVFDHVDDSGVSFQQHLENRLKIIEAYDRRGIHGYHVAEHHGTPLGYAASPSVFLAAAAQHTKRIKIGPLIYILPLYHPLRLIEEICMLDNLSDGRFMLGMGRGISPIEAGFFGVPGSEMQARYIEASDLILKALQSDTLNYQGKYYSFSNVPMTSRPIQKPHPELWFATRTPESFAWASKAGANTVTLAFDEQVKEMTNIYKRPGSKLDATSRTCRSSA